MRHWSFRGHRSPVDLAATVAASPSLAGRARAEDALEQALTAWAEERRTQVLAELARLVTTWREEARAVRLTKVRRARSPRLDGLPERLAELVAFVPDGGEIVRKVLPRGLWTRLAWPQPAAGVEDQALVDLQRSLERRVDPALAREARQDRVLAEAVARAARSLDGR
ncbi:hypothetical protein L6R53_04000 [Myxococcota bacterium]|nr:hypothetical protein [Myxococcota bacterium]